MADLTHAPCYTRGMKRFLSALSDLAGMIFATIVVVGAVVAFEFVRYLLGL